MLPFCFLFLKDIKKLKWSTAPRNYVTSNGQQKVAGREESSRMHRLHIYPPGGVRCRLPDTSE